MRDINNVKNAMWHKWIKLIIMGINGRNCDARRRITSKVNGAAALLVSKFGADEHRIDALRRKILADAESNGWKGTVRLRRARGSSSGFYLTYHRGYTLVEELAMSISGTKLMSRR